MKAWEILDLPRTDDIALIRNAFVDNFCAVDAEHFSEEGFLIMREAYIRAVNYARTGDPTILDIDLNDTDLSLTQEVAAFLLPIFEMRSDSVSGRRNVVIPEDVSSRIEDIVRLYATIMALSDDFYGKIEMSNWTKLFQSDLLCNPVIVNYLRLPLLKSFAANPLIPHSVWVYLDLVFHWKDNSYSIPSGYEAEKQILAIETDPRWELNFSLFHKVRKADASSESRNAPIPPMWDRTRVQVFSPAVEEDIDYELYATYRRDARNYIIEGNEEEAERAFVRAAEIYDKDPDLFVIYFEYLKGIKDEGKLKAIKDLHLMILNRLLEFFPGHFAFLLSRVELNAVSQEPSVVINEYKKLMQSFPDNLLVVYKLAEIYRRLGKDAEAKKYIKLIEKNYMNTQLKLKSDRELFKDPVACDEHYKMNERVMQELRKNREPEKPGIGVFKKKDRAG